jgi:hypothetical protein
MNIEQLNNYPDQKVRALFGMTKDALSQLLEPVLPELVSRRQAEQANRADRKGRSALVVIVVSSLIKRFC